MQKVDILYLEKDNRSTNIIYVNNKKENINLLIEKVLDELCYPTLSTIDGRIKAIQHNYSIHTYVPAYIDSELILQPIYPKKHWTQIYINVLLIKELINKDNSTIIKFIDNNILNIDVPYKKVQQLVNQCLDILNDQNRKKGNI